ncbi:hypothetical protein ACCS15_22520 [Klebsiella pneumoniae]
MDGQQSSNTELKLEVIRWHQRLQEITYLEAGQHMRALNQLMWQIPSFVIAVNGGLWYVTTLANEKSLWIIFAILAFFDATTIITLFRLRSLIGAKINKQKEIEDPLNNPILTQISADTGFTLTPSSNPTGFSHIVICCWTAMLLACITVNMFGCFLPDILSKPSRSTSYKATIKKINSEYIIEAKSGELK